MTRSNGGVKGIRNSAGGVSGTNFASGMWGLEETNLYVKESNWPKAAYTIEYLLVEIGRAHV